MMVLIYSLSLNSYDLHHQLPIHQIAQINCEGLMWNLLMKICSLGMSMTWIRHSFLQVSCLVISFFSFCRVFKSSDANNENEVSPTSSIVDIVSPRNELPVRCACNCNCPSLVCPSYQVSPNMATSNTMSIILILAIKFLFLWKIWFEK